MLVSPNLTSIFLKSPAVITLDVIPGKTGLPIGDYFILVDIPGLDTNNTYHVKITAADTVYQNLNFKVFLHGLFGCLCICFP